MSDFPGRPRVALEVPRGDDGQPTGDSSVLVVGPALEREAVVEMLLEAVEAYARSYEQGEVVRPRRHTVVESLVEVMNRAETATGGKAVALGVGEDPVAWARAWSERHRGGPANPRRYYAPGLG